MVSEHTLKVFEALKNEIGSSENAKDLLDLLMEMGFLIKLITLYLNF